MSHAIKHEVEEGSLRTYLGDFGLGKTITTSRVFGLTTMQSGFQAPEQLEGKTVDVYCDVYALGTVITELVALQPIWESSLNSFTIMLH